MKTTSICRRCHRLKPTDLTRCCATCVKDLRGMEQRRSARPEPEEKVVNVQAAARNAIVFIEPNLD